MGDPDLDLNLLRTLDVLLAERSVTRAAVVLGRSQPAVSHALGRLRDALDDPLLVRQGRALVPTPRAERLQAPLRRALAEVHRAIEDAGPFAPATARRTFTLAAPDALAPLVPDLLQALADAPGVRIEIIDARGPAALERADLLLDVLPDAAPGVVARRLGDLSTAVICRAGHPGLAAPWTLDAYTAWPHVLIRTADGLPSLVERALAAVGRTRTVGLAVGTLLLVPHVVARTDLLFTGPRELLAMLAGPLDLVLRDPPLPLPDVPVAAMWAERMAADEGHRWFRRRVAAVIRERLQPG